MAQKVDPEAKKEEIHHIFDFRLKPKGWEIFERGKRDGWSFIPSSLLPRQATRNHQEFLDAKNRVFQHGIEAVIGYEGLKEMIEQYGEDYAPTMPELSAHQVSICRAAVSQATNEGSTEEQEGIEDPSPTAGGADSVDERHSCPNHAHVQEFRGSSVAKASPGSDRSPIPPRAANGSRGSRAVGVASMDGVATISLIMNTMQQCQQQITSLETRDEEV
jgi:hypothetical protein